MAPQFSCEFSLPFSFSLLSPAATSRRRGQGASYIPPPRSRRAEEGSGAPPLLDRASGGDFSPPLPCLVVRQEKREKKEKKKNRATRHSFFLCFVFASASSHASASLPRGALLLLPISSRSARTLYSLSRLSKREESTANAPALKDLD